jgi:hypothetical protein
MIVFNQLHSLFIDILDELFSNFVGYFSKCLITSRVTDNSKVSNPSYQFFLFGMSKNLVMFISKVTSFCLFFDIMVKGTMKNIKGNGSGMAGMLFIFDSNHGFLYLSFLFNGFGVLRMRHWQQLVEFKPGDFISECHFYESA